MRMLVLALLLTSCGGLSPTTTFAGRVTPLAGTCDPASEAVLTLRDKAVLFAPNSGTLVLRGELQGSAIDAGLSLTAPDKTQYRISFRGELAPRRISGSYVTPRCRYTVSLTQRG